jgi:hypothetical protein
MVFSAVTRDLYLPPVYEFMSKKVDPRPIPTASATYTYRIFDHPRPIPTAFLITRDLYLPSTPLQNGSKVLIKHYPRPIPTATRDLYLP